MFRHLDAIEVGELEPFMRTRSIEAGVKVFAAGESGDEICFVRRGRIDILLPLEHGKRHHVATFGRGEFFGEMAFLDKGSRSADAEAAPPTELFLLSRKAFDALAEKNAGLAAHIFEQLALAIAQRLRAADAEVSALEER